MRLSTSFSLVPLHCPAPHPHRLSFTMHLSFYVNNLMFLSVEKEHTKLKAYDLGKHICLRETEKVCAETISVYKVIEILVESDSTKCSTLTEIISQID